MAVRLDTSFAVYEQALKLRAHRAEVLGANIANADTPGFQARDFDFAEAMRAAPHAKAAGSDSRAPRLGFRVPLQPSIDQNTVETHVEQAAFTENAIGYQAAIRLLNGRIAHLTTALTGR